jgi:hypothetical protein
MKIIVLIAFMPIGSWAQFPLPPDDNMFHTPTSFEPRNTGQTSEIEPETEPATPRNESVKRYVSQLELSESRSWTSTDGKVIEASLIAFEDMVVEARDGARPSEPKPPKHPTVVQNSSVRLFVNRKPVILELRRLSPADQAFVEQVRLQHAPKP